ncbi:hypothetical protein D3C73_950010 [compost metagenome]
MICSPSYSHVSRVPEVFSKPSLAFAVDTMISSEPARLNRGVAWTSMASPSQPFRLNVLS